MTDDHDDTASRPIFFLFEFAKYMTTVSFVLLGALATYCLSYIVAISGLLLGVLGLSGSLCLSFTSILLLVHQFGKPRTSDYLARLLMKIASLLMVGGFVAFGSEIIGRLYHAA